MNVDIAGDNLLRFNVTDAFAGKARIVGRTAQQEFVVKVAFASGYTEAEVWYCRGKRGVSNRGFIALVKVGR
jgi:hypothetical protein